MILRDLRRFRIAWQARHAWLTYETIWNRLAVEAESLEMGLARVVERLARRYGLADIAGALVG